MDEALQWLGRPAVREGAVEQAFQLVRAASRVPGVLWRPSPPVPAPAVVLLGHGGSGHKRSERIAGLARWFAAQAGLAAVAIDGPYHGDRISSPLTAPEYQARIAAEGIEAVLDRMAGDWRATVAALGALGLVDTAEVGYLGLSMGTRFGLPAAAALGGQLRCVVFGKFGLRAGPALHQGLAEPGRISRDARQITAPALFHVQWDDEVFPREGQLALFDQLGSPDKQLIAFTGPHAETRPEAITRWRDFVARHLAPAGP